VLLKTVMVVGSERSHPAGRRSVPRITALENVANRPIIHHVFDGLSEVSTDGVIIVGVAEDLGAVEASLRHYRHLLTGVEYLACRAPSDVGTMLAHVAPIVGEAACIVHPADGLLDSSAATFASMCDTHDSDVTLVASAPSENVVTDGWDAPDDAGPAEEENDSNEPEIAILGPGILLGAARSGFLGQDNRSLSKLGRSLATCGATVDLKEVDGWHRYSGDGKELLELNRVTLDRIVPEVPGRLRNGNQIEGQVRIDPDAVVRSSVLVGPLVIGPGAIVSGSYIGPYTAIGAGARIEGSEIERSIVFPGANLLHVGTRLVSSLVGRDARVVREFALPRALRLWVGDGDEIALC
jgi:glucose-1-phosphate thymidylyltransferase